MHWETIRKRVVELRAVADKLEAMLPHEEDVDLMDIEIIEDEVEKPPALPAKSFFDDISDAIDMQLREAAR